MLVRHFWVRRGGETFERERESHYVECYFPPVHISWAGVFAFNRLSDYGEWLWNHVYSISKAPRTSLAINKEIENPNDDSEEILVSGCGLNVCFRKDEWRSAPRDTHTRWMKVTFETLSMVLMIWDVYLKWMRIGEVSKKKTYNQYHCVRYWLGPILRSRGRWRLYIRPIISKFRKSK